MGLLAGEVVWWGGVGVLVRYRRKGVRRNMVMQTLLGEWGQNVDCWGGLTGLGGGVLGQEVCLRGGEGWEV